jgi:hypothetical protein
VTNRIATPALGLTILFSLMLVGSLNQSGAQSAAPNSINLQYFTAVAIERQPGQVQISWETTSEVDTAGYFIMRALSEAGPYEAANTSVILGQGNDLTGATYSYVDGGLDGGVTYYYYLRELQIGGSMNDYAELTASATPSHGVFLPMMARQ